MNYQTLVESLTHANDCRKETCLYNFSNSTPYQHSTSSAVKFMKNYCDMIIHSESPPMLGEKVGETMPVVSEFVFRFKNADLEELYFGKLTQPLYCLLDGNEELVQEARGADYFQFEVEPFVEFLKQGLAEYQKRQTK